MPELIYRGDCAWRAVGNPEPSNPPHELPTTREPWMGRQDQTDAFLATYAIGAPYLGGYIIENTPRDNTPFPGVASVDLIIARPPNFSAVLMSNSTSAKTVTLSAAGLSVTYHGVVITEGELSASFISPETRYTYFSSSPPVGSRYDSVAASTPIRLIRASLIGRGVDGDGNQREFRFPNGAGPAALVTALTLVEVDQVVHSAEPIAGTPGWYRCTDVVSREYLGD